MADSRVSPAEVVDHVARLGSSTEHSAGLHNLLGEADIDRFAQSQDTPFLIISHQLTLKGSWITQISILKSCSDSNKMHFKLVLKFFGAQCVAQITAACRPV